MDLKRKKGFLIPVKIKNKYQSISKTERRIYKENI